MIANLNEVERLLEREIRELMPNVIWQNSDGVYEVFGRYRIQPVSTGFLVFASETEIGIFSTTRTALSWCIADKYGAYNMAREMLVLDKKLTALKHDIHTRSTVGKRSQDPAFRETILIKLETKILHKKHLENELIKYINRAKYYQQRGFDNETARIGHGHTIKTSR